MTNHDYSLLSTTNTESNQSNGAALNTDDYWYDILARYKGSAFFLFLYMYFHSWTCLVLRLVPGPYCDPLLC